MIFWNKKQKTQVQCNMYMPTLDGGSQRRDNFYIIYDIFKI